MEKYNAYTNPINPMITVNICIGLFHANTIPNIIINMNKTSCT